MNAKYLLNKLIDYIYEKRRKKKIWKPLSNDQILKGLKKGTLFGGCIISRNNDAISKGISDLSGPFSHFIVIAKRSILDSLVPENALLQKKISSYYESYEWNGIQYLVLASADDNGMNYFDLSEYQNREMVIFDLSTDKALGIIYDFLKPSMMEANYDYTWIFGQALKYILLWIAKHVSFLENVLTKIAIKVVMFFDDHKAYGCSEEEELFRVHGIKLCEHSEPSPTDIYKYCKSNWHIVYTNLKKEY